MRLAPRSIALLLALAGAVALVRCGSGSGSGSAPPVCNCSATESCVAGKCMPLACTLPQPAPSAAQSPLHLGTMKVGDTATFSVPTGAASFTIIEQIVAAPASVTFTDLGAQPNTAAPLSVTDPNGTAVFDQSKAQPSDPVTAPLFFASSSPGVGTLTLPDTTAGLTLVAPPGLAPGTWRFVVSDLAHQCSIPIFSNCAPGSGDAKGTYDVTVIVKPGAGTADNIPATGKVDVTFNLTPSGIGLSAATAKTGSDPDLKRMVQTLGTLLGRAGLTLGNVDYVDVPDPMKSRVSSGVQIDDGTVCGELQQLLATAPAGDQVNLFMVSTFISSDVTPGTLVAGIDGTIPGPATVSPSLQSGAAVSAANLRSNSTTQCGGPIALICGPKGTGCCGADRVAYVVAHEMGHFFGLYHATEHDGTSFDPLQDTAECPCQTCAPDKTKCADATPPPATPHPMSVTECEVSTTCGGGDNLMFWLLDDASVGNLSAEQGSVIRASPAVQ